jgi:hypothetical protein
MSKHDKKHLEAILEQVSPTRRKFLRSSLIAGGVAALAAPVSSLLAQEEETGTGGKGKGTQVPNLIPDPAVTVKGKGKGKGAFLPWHDQSAGGR